jgi:hypothetical protein
MFLPYTLELPIEYACTRHFALCSYVHSSLELMNSSLIVTLTEPQLLKDSMMTHTTLNICPNTEPSTMKYTNITSIPLDTPAPLTNGSMRTPPVLLMSYRTRMSLPKRTCPETKFRRMERKHGEYAPRIAPLSPPGP